MAAWELVSGGLPCPRHSAEGGAPTWASPPSYSEAELVALGMVVAEASGDRLAGPSCSLPPHGRRGRIGRKHVARMGKWPG